MRQTQSVITSMKGYCFQKETRTVCADMEDAHRPNVRVIEPPDA